MNNNWGRVGGKQWSVVGEKERVGYISRERTSRGRYVKVGSSGRAGFRVEQIDRSGVFRGHRWSW